VECLEKIGGFPKFLFLVILCCTYIGHAGRAGLCSGHTTWDPRRHMYEELASHTPCRGRLPKCPGSDETMYHRAGDYLTDSAIAKPPGGGWILPLPFQLVSMGF
jgi:hypothetical protein